MSRRRKVNRIQSQPPRQQPATAERPLMPWEHAGEDAASCPYNLDSFKSYNTPHCGGTRNVADAYIILSPPTSTNPNGQMRLSVSRDVGDRIISTFDSQRYELLFNKVARIFAIRPKFDGAKFSASINGKKTRHSMSIQVALGDVRSVYGDNVRRIMLRPEFYDECVVFMPTGEITYADKETA